MPDKKKPLKIQIWEELQSRGWVTPLSQPPEVFRLWWKNHDHSPQRCFSADGRRGWTGGIDATKAWQCACYRDEFKERRYANAAGTGVYYAFYGWHRPFDVAPTTNIAALQSHRQWCKRHNKPDPIKSEPLTEDIVNAKGFSKMKAVIKTLSDTMDMNKAIGWTKEDSAALRHRTD